MRLFLCNAVLHAKPKSATSLQQNFHEVVDSATSYRWYWYGGTEVLIGHNGIRAVNRDCLGSQSVEIPAEQLSIREVQPERCRQR